MKLCSTGSELDRPPDRTIGRFFIFLYISAVGASYSSFHVFRLDGSSSALNLQVKSAMCCTFLMAAFRVWLEKPKPFRCYLNRRRIIRQFFFSFSWIKADSYTNSPHKPTPHCNTFKLNIFIDVCTVFPREFTLCRLMALNVCRLDECRAAPLPHAGKKKEEKIIKTGVQQSGMWSLEFN